MMERPRQRLLNVEAGTRRQSRLRVQLPGLITSQDGTRRVLIEDLSIRGARIRCDILLALGQHVMLQWDRFEALGAICWRGGSSCGIGFYSALHVNDLIASRELDEATAYPLEREAVRRAAAAFVKGGVKL